MCGPMSEWPCGRAGGRADGRAGGRVAGRPGERSGSRPRGRAVESCRRPVVGAAPLSHVTPSYTPLQRLPPPRWPAGDTDIRLVPRCCGKCAQWLRRKREAVAGVVGDKDPPSCSDDPGAGGDDDPGAGGGDDPGAGGDDDPSAGGDDDHSVVSDRRPPLS